MTTLRPIKLGVVTRLSRAAFIADSLLARSVRGLPPERMPGILLKTDNAPPAPVVGLSQAYNDMLAQADDGDILVFVHDDVFIGDWFLRERLNEAVRSFDVVGLAGNTAPDWRQPSWALAFSSELQAIGWQERTRLSGSVGHGDPGAPTLTVYGPCPAACPLLDGLFLAVDVGKVRAAGITFDTRFLFHAYDLDFCRSAGAAGLRIGTWPISVIHASGGNFDGPSWKQAAAQYLTKWGR